MPPTLKSLEEQGRALLAQQKTLLDDDTRPWTDRAQEFEGREADIKAVLANHAALKSVEAASGDLGPLEDVKPVETSAKSVGEQFVESSEFKSLTIRKGSHFSSGAVEVKATLTEAAGGAGLIMPTYRLSPVVDILFRRLTVADLMPSGAIDGNSLIYAKESTVTNAAAAVAEGASKPLSDLNVVQVTETLSKIATALKITDEMLQDVAATRSYVDARLMLFVKLAEEDELLNGSGTAPHLRGIMNRTGLQTAQALGTDTRPDAVYKQITNIRANAFVEPDAIVMHPTDWQTIRLLKDTTNGQYYGGGPFQYGPYGNAQATTSQGPNAQTGGGLTLWGLNVVITSAIAAGTALVGSFAACAQVFRKGGITVEATNSNEDDFLKNLVAVRAEERLLLAVYRPAGFGKITGL